MFRLEYRCLFQRFLPFFQCLPRQGKHQVDIHIPKTFFPYNTVILQKFLNGMDAPQPFQKMVLPSLHADAQTVEADASQCPGCFAAQRAGVCLRRNLRPFCNMERCKNLPRQPFQKRQGKCRRRSSAKKYRLKYPALAHLCAPSDFRQKRRSIMLLQVLTPRKRWEIAVQAFLSAKRYVYIKPSRSPQTYHPFLISLFHIIPQNKDGRNENISSGTVTEAENQEFFRFLP